MLKNYLKLTLRNIQRQPGYTAVNVLGLTVGITATLFILAYITEESQYDRYHERADRIFRVSSDITEPDDAFRWSVTQMPLGMQLKADYPEVEEYVRFIPNGRTRFEFDEEVFFVEDVYVVDSTVTSIFSYEFVIGDPADALRRPNSIALAQSVADRMFGNNDPIGRTVKTASGREYNVTGVYKDQPRHSHIIANAMITANTIDGLMNPNAGAWGGFNIYTYVLLHEGTSPSEFEEKLQGVIDQYVAVIFDQFDIKIKYELINIQDIHLKSTFEGEPQPTGEIGFLYIFGAVAFLMLLIACINYMNLSTARATKRATEVGIRKVLGSERRQLIGQFLSESVLFSLFALALSFGLVYVLMPAFNAAFDLELQRDLLYTPNVLLGALAIMLVTGVAGGSYPAFYLSGFKPISVLKGTLAKGTGNPNLRKALVGVQFAITLFMLVGTGIIYDQMQYLRNKDLGFDKENVLVFNLQGQESRDQYEVLKDRLLQNPKIVKVAGATSSPGRGYGKQLMTVETESGGMDEYGVDNYYVDFEYFSTMGMEIIDGRDFDPKFATDSNLAFIVNEAMVERMGWTDPIGKKLQPNANDSLEFATVIGVVKNFHQQSLYEPIQAIVFGANFSNPVVHVRLNPSNAQDLSRTLAYVEDQWREVFPGRPFEFEFVDTAFMDLYQEDQIRARIFTLFSVLMIFIACLGLLGLASFIAEQRTKEIGVRKILGAETPNIIYLLTRSFMVLVIIAAVPAFIAAWYFMQQWLGTFHYHTDMNLLLYPLALLMVAVITLLTTGYHALRAAHQNPVEALRYE